MRFLIDFQGLRYLATISLVVMTVMGCVPRSLAQEEVTVKIGVIPGALKFDTARFEVIAGSTLNLEFNNNGLMQHNLVLVRPGHTDNIVNAAMGLGANGQKLNWVPDSRAVFAFTPLVDAGKQFTLKFLTPAQPGDYPYVCTFPGHGLIMRGVMVVKAAGSPVVQPEKISYGAKKLRNNLSGITYSNHPLGTGEKPFIIRTYMPDPDIEDDVFRYHGNGQVASRYSASSGKDVDGEVSPIDGIPAAYGVNFGKDLSLCWDTTECRLMYVWKDGFLDMNPYWGSGGGGGRKSFDYVPRLEGTLVFKASGQAPFRAAAQASQPRFRGLSLKEGKTQFKYLVGEARISESYALNAVGQMELRLTISAGDSLGFTYRIPHDLAGLIESVDGKPRNTKRPYALVCAAGESRDVTLTFKFDN